MSENRRENAEEKKESSGIGKKRKAQGGVRGPEKAKRGKVRHLTELRKLELEILNKLDKENKRNSQLFLEISTWETVFKSMVDELKRKEEELERNYESVWQNREQFCFYVDDFVRDFENFIKSNDIIDEEIKSKRSEIEIEIESLELKVAEKEAAVEALDKNLQMLEKERAGLFHEKENDDIKRLEEWIEITCEKCAQLEYQIMKKKEHIIKKNEDLMNSVRIKRNNLYSIVNMDDVKKLSPFTTDSKPSSSVNLSLN